MAASRSTPPPPPPPPQVRSASGGSHISLFLDTDLGTHLALNVAADSTIRHLKSEVAVEHAAAFPDLGPVAVKSFQVLRKGAMYHLCDSMAVRSAFAKVKAGCFLHVKMAAVETDTQCCSGEDRGRSSKGCLGVDVYKRVRELPALISEISTDVLPQRLEVPNDVLLSSSTQQNAERKKIEAVSLASDVRTISAPVVDKLKSYNQEIKHGDQTEGAYVNSTSAANANKSTNRSDVSKDTEEIHSRTEDILHSVGEHDLGVVSGNKQVGIKEGILEESHALDGLSKEKELKRARKTGSLDTSATALIRETNDCETRDVNKPDRVPQETNINSHGVISGTSFQQEVHANVQEDSIQLENPSVAGKNKKRKKRQPVTSKDDVSAQEMTKPLTGAVEVPKAISERFLHEDNQGLQGDGAYNVEITSRDKAVVRPSDTPLSSSQLNSGIQGIRHVLSVSDACATNDLVADQGNVDFVHERYISPNIEDTGTSTSKVVTGEENSIKGTNNECHDEGAVKPSNMEKSSKNKNVLEMIHTAGNTAEEKNCKKAKKVSSVGIASMDTAEEKDQRGYGEKAAKSDIVPTQGKIVNDPEKQQISSNVQQGDSNVIENPNGDGKQKKKKRRRHSESSKDKPTQDATKSPGLITDGSLTQNTSAHPLDAKQTTLGTIREATVEEKDQCEPGEKAARPVIVSTQREIVNDPSNVQQGDSNVIVNPNGDGKQKKKRRRHSESLKDYPTQDVIKSRIQNTDAKQATTGTIEEATVSDCKMLDESLGVAATNVIDGVLADLTCTYSLSKGLDGDLLTGQTHLGSKDRLSAALPPKYPAAVHSDAPISLPSHKKSKGKRLKVLSTVLDSSHSSDGAPEENVNMELRDSDSLRCSDKIIDLKDVLTDNTVGQADDTTKATKHQRKKTSLKHVPADSGKAIQCSGEQVSQVAAEDLKGANATKAESPVVQKGTTAVTYDNPNARKGRKKYSKTEQSQNTASEHDSDADLMNSSCESPVVQKGTTAVTYDNPNARKGRKKYSKTEQSQNTASEHDSDADLMNSRVQWETVSPKSCAHAGEPNGYEAVHPDNDKINFIDHFSPSGTNGPSDFAENKEDETIREVKGKKKSKRKQDMHSQRAGSIEPNDLLESHPHTGKTSLTDHFGTGNVRVPSVPAEDGNVKKAKEKRKNRRKLDLVKPESENPNVDHQDNDNSSQNLLHSVLQKGRMEQDNAKENNVKVVQNNSMLQQQTEDSTCDSTLERKHHQIMFHTGSQTNLYINKDHAGMSKEQKDTSSQIKHHAKSRNHDGSISGRTGPNPKAVSNLVKSFSMSPPASSESVEGTPQNGNRYRVAVRKVPRKRYEQVNDKSKNDGSKRGTGAIFNDAISEGSDDILDIISKKSAMETSSDDSSIYADSGISSAGRDGSDLPDDDGIVSLSQRSLKEGLHIGSILRGSSSYKKARLKQTEQLDDTEVPDSQPADDF